MVDSKLGNRASEQPVVQRMNTDIGSHTWYKMYPRMKNISTNENVETSMIWGCLWDETLQWFIDTEAKTQEEVGSDSSSWGNYNNVSFEYTNTSGTTTTKNTGDTRIPTGSTERNKANNIYDMAGNVYELTLEGTGSSDRVIRGGPYNDPGTSYPVRRRITCSPNGSGSSFRGQGALYYQIDIKCLNLTV